MAWFKSPEPNWFVDDWVYIIGGTSTSPSCTGFWWVGVHFNAKQWVKQATERTKGGPPEPSTKYYRMKCRNLKCIPLTNMILPTVHQENAQEVALFPVRQQCMNTVLVEICDDRLLYIFSCCAPPFDEKLGWHKLIYLWETTPPYLD